MNRYPPSQQVHYTQNNDVSNANAALWNSRAQEPQIQGAMSNPFAVAQNQQAAVTNV